MKEININHINIDLDGDGIPEKYILKDKALNTLFLTLANIAFSSDYNDLINQPTSLPASDVYEWAKNIAKPEYTKNEIGLGNVDNTSDLNKPVSIAQQKAIDDAYGSKANKNEFDSHVGNDTIHITSSERTKWNNAISGTDDTKDNVVSFTSNDTTNPTSWSDVSALTSGEKHTSIFTKISTMFKNIRYLYKLIGTTDISAIGNGTITGGLISLNSNLNDRTIQVYKYSSANPNIQKGNTYQYAPIRLNCLNTNDGGRVGIGFENAGLNAGFLYLASDGNLYFMDHLGVDHKISMT